MPFEQRPDTGTLFKNDRKTTEKHPDYKGKILVGEEEYEIAAWIREGKKGKFLSLKVNPAGQRYGRPQGATRDGDPF